MNEMKEIPLTESSSTPFAPLRLQEPLAADEIKPGRAAPMAANHLVQFYDRDELLITAVATFLAEGARAGDDLIVIATQAHQDGFQKRLEELGCDVSELRASGQLIVLDAHETLQ